MGCGRPGPLDRGGNALVVLPLRVEVVELLFQEGYLVAPPFFVAVVQLEYLSELEGRR